MRRELLGYITARSAIQRVGDLRKKDKKIVSYSKTLEKGSGRPLTCPNIFTNIFLRAAMRVGKKITQNCGRRYLL